MIDNIACLEENDVKMENEDSVNGGATDENEVDPIVPNVNNISDANADLLITYLDEITKVVTRAPFLIVNTLFLVLSFTYLLILLIEIIILGSMSFLKNLVIFKMASIVGQLKRGIILNGKTSIFLLMILYQGTNFCQIKLMLVD